MTALFETTHVDREIYQTQLRDFLPDRLIDIHTHVWLKKFASPTRPERVVSWPSRVAEDNSIEDMEETYRLMFPGKKVTPLIFTTISVDLDPANAYCAECARTHDCHALVFSTPEWTGADFERRIQEGGFVGTKSYLTMSPSYLHRDEIRIYDFFPPHQLEVLNAHGWIMMLHIPRSGRLRDPVNLAQMMEIDQRYPNIKTIIAHVGRAYCPEDVGDAFQVLRDSQNLLFDFSANTNQGVFEQLIQAIGPRRILFGSDLPILRMRMRRICEDGNYVNIVPQGMYGDVSGDSHMRDVGGAEADKLTFFMYEELLAFRRAAETTGLSRDDIDAVFHGNAQGMLQGISGK